MGIFSFESFALVCIFVALGAYLVWAEIKAAGQRVQDVTDRRLIGHWKDELAKSDEAERRRMIYETDQYNEAASMEPFCGEGNPLSEKEKREELARLNLPGWANTPEHLRADPYTRMGP